ncbi:hypothetical protein [Leifsonia aquatica]|uniref:hypothetical protein n=1 Tax=Leifsonia aquatica TaxID=144185 RepID=UPI0037FE3B72
MSDEAAEPEVAAWDPAADPDGYTWDDVRPKDWYLDTVLNFAHGFSDETVGGTVGLTVTSNGVLVSGLAISRTEWIAATVDQYKQSGAAGTAPYIDKLFNEVHDDVVDAAAKREAARLPRRAQNFLHMKDVRLGTGTVTTQVPLWRGALADITGWSMGSWNPPLNNSENPAEGLAAD